MSRIKGQVGGVALAVLFVGLLMMPAVASAANDPYPLDTCPVSGKKLESMDKAITLNYEGRDIRFCCAGCPDKFKADPAKYLESVDAAIIKQQKDHYPLDVCPISGEKLGSMGDPVDIVVGNRHLQLCCAGCKKKAAADPAKMIAMLDKAVIEKQSASYALDTCPISGEKIENMDEATNVVIANRLVKVCCAKCVKKVNADPVAMLSKLDEAQKK